MLKYKNNGFIPGVPARDLTDEEVIRYGKIPLINTGLYEEEIAAEIEETPKKGKNNGHKETKKTAVRA